MRIILGLILALAVVFALQNSAAVTLAFINWRFETSLAVVVAFSFIAGALVGALLLIPGVIRKARTLRKLRNQLDNTLQNAPHDVADSSEAWK